MGLFTVVLKDWRIATRAMFATLMILAAFIVDPLGIRNSAENHYEDHILRLWSPFYSDEVSKDIIVVLIDDAFIETTKAYPVNYRNLARLLKTLSAYNPSSVFFDILQHHEHSSNLNLWLRTLNTRDFPTYMASNAEYDTVERLEDTKSMRFKIANSSRLAAVSWSGEGRYYPLYVDWNDREMPTVAMMIYKDWCSVSPNCQLDEVKDWEHSIIVQWSNKFSPNQPIYFPLKHSCGELPASSWVQMFNLLSVSLMQGLHSDDALDSALRTQCPPFTTVSASKLLSPGSAGSEDLKELFKGKHVLVGYHITGGTDTVASPVHGVLPGVFFHAMALDNLFQFGEEYWRVPESAQFLNLNTVDLIEIVVQCTALFFVIWFRFKYLDRSNSPEPTPKNHLLHALLPMMTIITVISVSIIISHFWLNVGAPNWYGLLMIIFIDLPIFFYYIFEAIKPRIDQHLIKIKLFFELNIKSKLSDKRTFDDET